MILPKICNFPYRWGVAPNLQKKSDDFDRQNQLTFGGVKAFFINISVAIKVDFLPIEDDP
jgi:hypothetical protein